MHENSKFNPYTQDNDSRIFPYGQIMRKMRIDELPQFWNVIKGDMHLIGPRAEWNILTKEYELKIPNYNKRHLVRPGITGLAQVYYPYGRNLQDAKNKLKYDLLYIKNWSLWLEIRIIWLTMMVVFGKKGM
jgi:lipopolysaccharide/colanic/teichoic acid biosynthesis glycosyltransferase